MRAELEAKTQLLQPQRRLTVLVAGTLLLLALGIAGFWLTFPKRVHVNFITEPWDASVYLDGEAWAAPDGTDYRTPCTIPDLPARVHHVMFKREGAADFDAGQIDFAEIREIVVQMTVDSGAPGGAVPRPTRPNDADSER